MKNLMKYFLFDSSLDCLIFNLLKEPCITKNNDKTVFNIARERVRIKNTLKNGPNKLVYIVYTHWFQYKFAHLNHLHIYTYLVSYISRLNGDGTQFSHSTENFRWNWISDYSETMQSNDSFLNFILTWDIQHNGRTIGSIK